MPILLVLAAALQSSQLPADAYPDSSTASIVAQARARRERNERLVTRYQATVSQRVGIGIRALRRDRMLYRLELVARIDWRRDGRSRVEYVGARQSAPVAQRGLHVPGGLNWLAATLVFDPSEDYTQVVGEDFEGILHPLAPESERDYRFETGDTTRIISQGSRTLRLVELRVIPRRDDSRLLAGSFWFDLDTYGVVRAVFRLARPFILSRDLEREEWEDIPRTMRPTVADTRFELRYVTVEYGFYEGRWWLPRLLAFDGEASVGSMMRLPARMERTYEITSVEGGSAPAPGARPPAGSSVSRRRRLQQALATNPDSIAREVEECVRRYEDREAAANAAAAARGQTRIRFAAGPGVRARCTRNPWFDSPNLDVVLPADTQSLLASGELGAPILDMGDVMSEPELRELAADIGALPERSFAPAPPELRLGVGWAVRSFRWNRIEALSLGAGLAWDVGTFTAEVRGRIGAADAVPNGELSLVRRTFGATLGLAGYHRLAAANPETRPFGILNSLNSMLIGRDDGEYFRAAGLELTARPGATRSGWYELRLYAERQRPVGTQSSASLALLFDGDRRSRPNITAARADAVGLRALVRGARALGVNASAGVEIMAEGVAGTFDYGRASLTARFTTVLAGLALGVEGAAGASAGPVPPQGQFFLGGPATLRGYAGGAAAGNSFGRMRAELANGFPAWRLALFSDAGWAGPRTDYLGSETLWSVGIGTSILDGLIRFDLAKGMRGSGGWRFDITVDGIL